MLPTFFVIGAGKAGTSSLYEYLSLHPEIHMSPVKEPNFLVAEPGPAAFFAAPRIEGRDEYEALFRSELEVRGEASHHYTSFPVIGEVPARMHRLVPEARLLYLVRDPIERIESEYVQNSTHRAGYVERREFAEALGDLDDPANMLIAKSRYMTQVRRYLEHFDRSRLMVIDSAELYQDRSGTLSAVFEFLGVDPGFESASFAELHNPGGAQRRPPGWYSDLDRSLLSRVLGARTRTAVGRLATSLAGSPISRPSWPEASRRAVERLLGPEVAELRELTGKRFASWSL